MPSERSPETTSQALGRGLGPSWLQAVLVAVAGPGVVASLVFLWSSFIGTGPYGDPSLPGPTDVRFADRAGWWIDLGASTSAFATLLALGAFAWVAARQAPERGTRPALVRRLGATLAGVMSVLMTWGLVAVVVGEVALRLDPTAARDPLSAVGLFRLNGLLSSLVLAVLFAALAWGLWRPDRLGELLLPRLEPEEPDTVRFAKPDAVKPDAPVHRSRTDARNPPRGTEAGGTEVRGTDDDAQALFRRPPG